jgi:hypothetical protein
MTQAIPPDDAEDVPDGVEDADDARVRELRERIARGEYQVDPEAIARRILERGDLEAAEQADELAPPALRLVEQPGEPEAVDPDAGLVETPDDEFEGESGA